MCNNMFRCFCLHLEIHYIGSFDAIVLKSCFYSTVLANKYTTYQIVALSKCNIHNYQIKMRYYWNSWESAQIKIKSKNLKKDTLEILEGYRPHGRDLLYFQ